MNRDNDKGKVLIRRSLIMAAAMFVLLMVVIMRLYYLQVYQSDKFKMMADENRISTRLLVPPRGVIYDRNDVPLAINQQNFQAMIVAEQVTNLDETLQEFSKVMPLSDEEVDRIKKEIRRNRSFVPIKVKDKLTWEDVARIQLNAPDLPGVIIDEGLTRYYPYGEKMAHLLGYVSSVSENDEKDDPLLEVPSFKIGKAGIEKLFEKSLRGKAGVLKSEVNAYGRIMKEIERVDGTSGANIHLSIDARLQEIAYDAFGEESGAAILIDIKSGEILAFVSTPAYDPNTLSQGVNATQWNELLMNERKPMSNKAINGQYSPGSTFKMIVSMAALEARAITPSSSTYCSGQMFLGNHAFHCWRKEGHGSLTVAEALEHSCDIFFYEAAQKTGIEKIAEMARKFGLGRIVDIGIDGEKPGLIPDKEWKKKKFKEAWQQGETLVSGIGQGYILTTPIQLSVMTAAIANGGYLLKPKFLRGDADERKDTNKLDVSDVNLAVVREGMCRVVNEQRGTAYRSHFEFNGAKMCGKTGTTQVRRISMKERQTGILKDEDLPWRLRNHALFVAYAPHDNPKYAIAVLVEHGGGGSKVAAPIASKVLLQALKIDATGEN